jgi:hypothetical protein
MPTITTNNRPRKLTCLADLPSMARADFDYITEEEAYSPRLFAYRGTWYDVNEFMRFQDAQAFRGSVARQVWDGYHCDTYFSGIVLRYVPDTDYEFVVVGRFYYSSVEAFA